MLPNAIRAARQKNGLTQAQLADELDVSRAAVAHWENGRYRPSPRRLIQLEQALGGALADVSIDATSESQAISPRASRGARRPMNLLGGLREVSLVEVMSPYWRRDEVAVFHATDTECVEFDLLIGDFDFHMRDASMISGLLFRGDRLAPHVRDGTLVKLAPWRQARPEDHVLIVGGAQVDGRAARFGRLIEVSSDHVLLRRYNPDHDEQIALSDCSTIFRVLEE